MTQSISEGLINIEITTSSGAAPNPAASGPRLAVSAVQVHSRRPFQIQSLFVQRSSEEVLARVGAVYGICRHAHIYTAARALHGAGQDIDREILVLSRHKAQVEALAEHAWRLLMDLPRTLGKDPATAPLIQLRQTLNRVLDAQDSSQLLASLQDGLQRLCTCLQDWGFPLDDSADLEGFLAGDNFLASLLRDCREATRHYPRPEKSAVVLMPADFAASHCGELAAVISRQPDWLERPDWQGHCLENSPYSFHQQHPWLVALRQQNASPALLRLMAHLISINALLKTLEAASQETDIPGQDGFVDVLDQGPRGNMVLSSYQTARGLLMHFQRWLDGRLVNYRVIAPTEWNFHPQGAFASEVKAMAAADQSGLEQLVSLARLSLSPCVPAKTAFTGAPAGVGTDPRGLADA